MSKKFEKILSETTSLPAEAKDAICEAWETNLLEAKAELRQEFAEKYEHDKEIIVNTIDQFVSESIKAELEELSKDKAKVVEARVKYTTKTKDHAMMLDKFITEALSKEVAELIKDRSSMRDKVAVMESFMVTELSKEILEFQEDKKELARQRVKLVTEGKEALRQAKEAFFRKAATIIDENVNKALRTEIVRYREDILEARKVDFGRRIFEAFAGEYMASYLNEGSEVQKLLKVLDEKDTQIKQIEESKQEQSRIVESYETRLLTAKEALARQRVMESLTRSLSTKNREIMCDLLESVKTKDLKTAFNKYLGAVMNEETQVSTKNTVLSESTTEYRGDRAQKAVAQQTPATDELSDIKRLAGI